ncbi:hypothetical protein CZP2022_123 [Vibrio phage C-ZP2022]|nr:hypothetical protein CZP2022_123 [Vibrio phage C-ZP2022]
MKQEDLDSHVNPSEKITNGTFIGSREVPVELRPRLLKHMRLISQHCVENAIEGWSGAAPGMDTVWRKSYEYFGGGKYFHQILPWNGFQDFYVEQDRQYVLDEFMTQLASVLLWDCGVVWLHNLSRGVKAMYLRNVFQVVLPDFSQSDFVAYYAPVTKNGTPKGGTAIAVRLAKAMGIPTFNLLFEEDATALYELLGIKDDKEY